MIGKNAAWLIYAFLLALLLIKGMPNISVQVLGPKVKVLVDYLPLTSCDDDRFVLGIFTDGFTDVGWNPSDCLNATYNQLFITGVVGPPSQDMNASKAPYQRRCPRASRP